MYAAFGGFVRKLLLLASLGMGRTQHSPPPALMQSLYLSIRRWPGRPRRWSDAAVRRLSNPETSRSIYGGSDMLPLRVLKTLRSHSHVRATGLLGLPERFFVNLDPHKSPLVSVDPYSSPMWKHAGHGTSGSGPGRNVWS